MSVPLLSIQGLTKTYPGVVANSDVTFDIGEGEVHALLGENGAGKSTLVKAIYGLIRPNEGTMLWRGAAYAPSVPAQARATGVAMVFQHFSLFDAMDVAENVALGMDNPPPISDLAARITEVSGNYGLPLDPHRMVGDLSAGERQRVEIIRCLLQNPQLLIMDEPTSVLTPQEVEILFRTLRQLRSEGKSILYISHKLEEIRALCENATVLRLGKVVGRADPRQESARSLAEMMVGQVLHQPSRTAVEPGKVLLQVTNLSLAPQSAFGTSLKDISVTVRAGEILGIGGVAGNGQDELLGALSGEMRAERDAIRMIGEPIGHYGPTARRAMGLLCAPEERLGHAAAPDMSLTENALLTGAWREKLVSRGFVNWGKARGFAERVIERFDVRTPGPHVAARALSGGNLQKFVIGREIMQRPSVLVVNQPTWGVDASAAAAIRQALLDLAQAGAAVIVISQDLDEILEVADQFAALNAGRLSAPRPVQGLTMDQIGLMLGGAEGDSNVAA
jgi:simple sugar transport system ATP-binding protein